MVHNFPFYKTVQLEDCAIHFTNFGIVHKNPEWKIGEHKHDHFELHYVDNGLGMNICRSDHIQLSRGVLYIARPGESHEQYSQPSDPMKLFYAGFHIHNLDGSPLQPELAIPELTHLPVSVFSNCFCLEPIIARIISEVNLPRTNSCYMIQSLFSQLMIELFRTIYDRLQDHTFGFIDPADVRAIQSIVLYMQQNIASPFDVEQLARISCMSTSHFRRLFKQVTGNSPGRYFLEQKIAYARLLIESGSPITEAAEETGFHSLEHFSKTFKKFTGISPSQCKKTLQQSPLSFRNSLTQL